MKSHAKRPLAILLVICLSLLVGLLVDVVWKGIDRITHPDTYRVWIEQYGKEYDVPPHLIAAVIKTESSFDPKAESRAGAKGLMQMMPVTFEWLTGEEHLGEFLPQNKLFDPEINIRYGTYYLRYLYDKFQNWDTTLAAYNGGEGNVASWLSNPEYSEGNGSLTYIPFSETRSYIKKVGAAMEIYEKFYQTKSEDTSHE